MECEENDGGGRDAPNVVTDVGENNVGDAPLNTESSGIENVKVTDEVDDNDHVILERVTESENIESDQILHENAEVKADESVIEESEVIGENQVEATQLGKHLENKLDEAVRRSSTEDETDVVKETSSQRTESGSLKRKLEDEEVLTADKKHRDRDDKDRSSEHRSKDHKKSSRDRDGDRKHKDRERSHHDRDKDRSHHDRDRAKHRDRDRERDRKREKKQVASVEVQCDIGTEVKEEPRLIFPDGHDDPPTVRLCGYSMANPLHSLAGIREYKYAHLMYLELYANGGGKVLHAWQEDVDKLSETESWIFAEEFLKEAFIEVNNLAMYCAAIVHNAAKGLPDFLEYLGDEHPTLPVKHGVIGHPRELETTTMTVYRDKVRDHFCAGTFRYGHLDNLSLVGTASEEAGGFFPDILDMLDEIPILSLVITN